MYHNSLSKWNALTIFHLLIFFEVKIKIMNRAGADVAVVFEAVKMLKHIVFTSQMNMPCFSHSKTLIRKSNQRSVAKCCGQFQLKSHLFETPCGSPEFKSRSHNRLPVSCSVFWKTVWGVLAPHGLRQLAAGENIDVKIIRSDHNIYEISI